MTPDAVAHIVGQMFMAAFWISAPLLAIGFVTGILISLIQVVTSIQDSGFNSIPRLIAFLGGSLLLMPWMIHKSMAYAIRHPGESEPLCPLNSALQLRNSVRVSVHARAYLRRLRVSAARRISTRAPEPRKIVLSLAFTLMLGPNGKRRSARRSDTASARIVAGLAGEAALGLAIGVALAIVLEVFQMAAQIVSLQAGFGFASTIDPASGADSTVLLTIAQLTAGLLFFVSGADRLLVRALADSLRSVPPESFTLQQAWAEALIQLFRVRSSLGTASCRARDRAVAAGGFLARRPRPSAGADPSDQL